MRVSIPFKRETSSKPKRSLGKKSYRKAFQFPSNGKLLPNSPQNPVVVNCLNLFQFPSNGKLLPNWIEQQQ